MLAANDRTFDVEVLRAPAPTLVHFWAPWCGLCRLIVPTLMDCHQEWGERFKLVSINADENFQLANTYKLTILPTLLLFERGRLQHRFEGVTSKADLRQSLDAVLASLSVLQSA
ncbi:MAG: thioredoxin domain-containing protein [Cyanobacteria bacterium J06641_5]